jgi:hypothetical protein
MIRVGFDLDKVVSLLRFAWIQAILDHFNEKFFWWLQKFRFLQRFYNCFFRIANSEIRAVMKELKERGFGVIVVSASNENYRQELEKWLSRKGFCLDKLYLKENPEEECLGYKERVTTSFCQYYIDDKQEIVDRINKSINSDGRCQAFLYQGQKKDDLLELLPLFKIFKTA